MKPHGSPFVHKHFYLAMLVSIEGAGGLAVKHKIQDAVIMGCPKLELRPWQQIFSDSTPLTTNTAHWTDNKLIDILYVCSCVFMLYICTVGHLEE